jgi:hypothetical protein
MTLTQRTDADHVYVPPHNVGLRACAYLDEEIESSSCP